MSKRFKRSNMNQVTFQKWTRPLAFLGGNSFIGSLSNESLSDKGTRSDFHIYTFLLLSLKITDFLRDSQELNEVS